MSATGRPRVAMASRKLRTWARMAGAHVLLQVLLGLVLGVLFELVLHVDVDRLFALRSGSEVVARRRWL